MAITTAPSKTALPLPILLIVPILILGLYLLPGSLAGKMIGEGEQLTSRNEQVTEPFRGSSVWLSATPSHAPGRHAYRPVLAQLLRMEYHAWQGSPSSYHAVSLILYLGIVVLFLLLSGRLMNHAGARVAAFVTLALHPMFTQAVENVAGQGVLLALLASLGALYVFQLCRQGKLGLGWSAPVITLLGAVAVGSHELGLLLPVWLAAVARLTRVEPETRPRAQKKSRKRLAQEAEAAPLPAPLGSTWRVLALALPLAGVVGGYLYLRSRALGGVLPPALEGLGSAMAQGPSIMAAYLRRLCWPVHPTYFYLISEKSALLPPPALGWAVLLGLAALTAWACRRWTALGLGLALMLTPLAALAHFMPLTTFMSEQPLVFALPGFGLVIGAVAGRLTAAGWLFPPARRRDQAVAAVLCLAWLAMAWQVYARVRQWSTPETLWAAEVALHPASALPLIEQLDAAVRQNNADAARRVAREARRKASPAELDRVIEFEALLAANIKDDDRLKELIDESLDETRKPGADHLSRMALFARDRAFRVESVDLWRRELQLYPKSFDANFELAQVELNQRNFKDALRLGAAAVSNAPRSMQARALERYGIILAECGLGKQAADHLQAALLQDRSLYRAYIYLARILWGAKEYQQARTVLEVCFANVGTNLTSYIDVAQMYTGILEDQKQTRQALDWIQFQMSRFPSDIPLQVWGARYLIEYGFFDRAYQTYQAVLPLAGVPKAEVAVGLGLLAQRANKDPKNAARYWRQALQLDPTNADAKRLLDALEAPAEPAKDVKPAPPARTDAATTAALAATPPAPSPTPASTLARSVGAGVPMGAPLTGLSITSPAPVTTATMPAVPQATPIPTPVATPQVTPSPTPAATPAAPVATPANTPVPTPAMTPAATPLVTPAAPPTATPTATPAVP